MLTSWCRSTKIYGVKPKPARNSCQAGFFDSKLEVLPAIGWPLQSPKPVGHFVLNTLVGFNQVNQAVIAFNTQAFIFNGFYQRIFIAAGFFQSTNMLVGC